MKGPTPVGDARLVWAIFAPWVAGLLAVLCLQLRDERHVPGSMKQWLDIAALSVLCIGLLAAGPLLLPNTGDATLLGLKLAAQPLSKAGLLAANVSLLCAVFIAWAGRRDEQAAAFRSTWAAVGACLVSGLLAASLLVAEPLVQVLCLFAASIAISGIPMLQVPPAYLDDDEARTLLALRLAAGLKYLALSAAGTVLLAVGTLLIARYGLSMENRGLLQTGLAALSVGLVVRSGAMPFSAAYSDMVRSAPATAVMALGAGIPAAVALGLLLLSPAEGGSVVRVSSLAWLGAMSGLLAGLRALYAGRLGDTLSDSANHVLLSMSAVLPLGWALFGVFSGLPQGAAGASALAWNVALAVPLLVASRAIRAANARLSLLGTRVGALSLLGLPPFGGFGGTLLVAQAAANLNGVWLLLLLLGSVLAAGGWLGWASRAMPHFSGTPRNPSPLLASPLTILVYVLIAAQFALFLLSGRWAS